VNPVSLLPIVPAKDGTMSAHKIRRAPRNEFEIDRSSHPTWRTGAERAPAAGDEVVCTAGPARIIEVHGRTGDGSRLLELELLDQEGAKPFFAAASNVLMTPRKR
jgi:hypothetical protein